MPVNINLLSDDTIARGVLPADIGNFGTSFAGTQDYLQKQREQNLFSGGVPRDANGDIDFPKAAQMILQTQGTAGLPTLTALRALDIQQQALKQNANLPDIFPPLPTQPRVQFPGSTGRPPGQAPSQYQSSVEPDQGGGEPPAGGRTDLNLTSKTEVPGSAQYNVDGGPMMALASEPQQLSDAYPRKFGDVPPGPATDRFTPPDQPTQVAENTQRPRIYIPGPGPNEGARPPPGIAPPRPPVTDQSDPGYWTLENARAYDRAAYIFNMRGQNLDVVGLKGSAGPLQQAKELAARAHEIYDHLSKLGEQREKSQLEEKRVLPEKAAAANIARLEKTRESADNTAQSIIQSQDTLNQLNSKSGIFSGAWAEQKLKWSQIAQTLGYPVDVDKINSTQVFMARMGEQVASNLKKFGSGAGITDTDLRFAERMLGGKIDLNEDAIRRILEINDKVSRGIIKKHNVAVDRIIGARPDARGELEQFKVDMPPVLSGRITQSAPQPQAAQPAAKPQTWTSSKGNTYQVNPDGSLAPLAPRQ